MSKLDLLREEILVGRLNRRSVLKRAMALGLSAPIIASLLAACGDDEEADVAPAEGEATEPATEATEAPAVGEATEPAAEATPDTAAEATATGEGSIGGPTGNVVTDSPGHGRGVAEVLRILYWQAPTILNPHFSQGTKDSAASSLVLEPLIDVLTDGTLIPVLAAEVPSVENGGVAPDGTSVTYKLKEGVVWSDGTPFTAEDVRFTWEYVTSDEVTTTTVATYEIIESIEVIDDHTVTINFREPTPGWFSPFATGFGGQVLPKHVLETFMGPEARNAPFNLSPIGTGPYKVQEFRAGDAVLYEMNENYREADKPYFQRVEWKGGGDAPSAARAVFQSGETDWAWNLQVEASVLVPMAEDSQIAILHNPPGLGTERVLVQFADPRQEVDGAFAEPTTQHPFLSELAVRQAFAHGVDRNTIAEQLYGPAGRPFALTLAGPGRFVSDATGYEFDIERAKQLLEEAGWTGSPRSKDGVTMNVLYQTSINSLRQKEQEIVKAAWEEMGVPTEIKSIDAAVFFSSDAGNPDTASHFYADFEMFTNSPSVPYPIDYMANYKSTDPALDIAQKSNQWSGPNYYRWVNEEFNQLWTQAKTELDPTRQEELFIAMNEMITNEVVEIPMVLRSDVVGINNQLKGYNTSPWTPDVRDIANWYLEE